jgi:hypothetical protein
MDLGIKQGIVSLENSQILVQLHGQDRNITIQDNGLGLSNSDAHVILRTCGVQPEGGNKPAGLQGDWSSWRLGLL